MTLQEAQDKIAKSHHYKDWDNMYSNRGLGPEDYEAAAELYANSKTEKLQAFKDYVHKRLDDAGIEKEPNGEHSKHGCRIGDRLDIALNQYNQALEVVRAKAKEQDWYYSDLTIDELKK